MSNDLPNLPIDTDELSKLSIHHLSLSTEPSLRLSPLTKGASVRLYYRLESQQLTEPLVLMCYQKGHRDHDSFLPVSAFLQEHQLPVPRILAAANYKTEHQLLWLQDLGAEDLWAKRHLSWPERKALYCDALSATARLHQLPTQKEELPQGFLSQTQPAFDSALYQWEQDYFFEEYLAAHDLLSPATLAQLKKSTLAQLPAFLASFPKHWIHRDLQSQNLMLKGNRSHFIDYQGLRLGLPHYDLASLLHDPYVPITPSEVAELLAYYQSQNPTLDPAHTDELFTLCSAQRLMQALGAYGKLTRQELPPEQMTQFQAAIPIARERLHRIALTHPWLTPLAELLPPIVA